MKTINKIFVLLICFSLINLPGCRDWFGENKQAESILSVDNIPMNIIITSPQHGSTWKPGETIPIKWFANEAIPKVNIELYRKTNLQFAITEDLVNNGYYEWKIPSNINYSVHYIIKISSINNAKQFGLSEQFTIID